MHEEFDQAFAHVDALITELARYFDAIETDVESSNPGVVKGGLDMFKVGVFIANPFHDSK